MTRGRRNKTKPGISSAKCKVASYPRPHSYVRGICLRCGEKHPDIQRHDKRYSARTEQYITRHIRRFGYLDREL